MKIIIFNFRGIEHAEYQLNNDQLVLIKGQSGIGKSTIFNAITWGLYGHLRNVDPIGSNKPKLKVVIEIDTMIIMRQKNPGLLKVITQNKEIEDDVAQCLIDQTFGGRDLWYLTSYVSQNNRNMLLTSSNNDKMDVLRQIAFNNDNPEQYIDKIDNEIKTISRKIDEGQALVNYHKQVYNDYFNKESIKAEDQVYSFDVLEKEVKDLNLQLSQLEEKELNNERNLAILFNLDQRLTQLNKEKQSMQIDEKINDKITQLEKDLLDNNMYNIAQELYKVVKLLKDRIASIPDLGEGSYTDEDYYRTIEQEQIYYSNERMLKSYGCEYKEEKIKEDIICLQVLLNNQPYVSTYQQLQRLKKELSALPSPKEDIKYLPSLNDLNQQLYSAISRSKLHTCPNCLIALSFDGHHLVKSNDKPSNEEEIKQIRQRINEVNKAKEENEVRNRILTQCQQLESLLPASFLDKPIPPLLTANQLQACQQQLTNLKGVKLFSLPPVRGETIKQSLMLTKLKKELAEAELRYRPYSEVDLSRPSIDVVTTTNNLNRLRQQKASYDQLINEEKRLIAEQSLIKSKLTKSIADEIKTCKEKKERLLNRIDRGKKYQQVTTLYNKYADQYNLTNLDIGRYQQLEKVKGIVVNVQNQLLQSMVDTINSSLEEVGNRLFPSPISIRLNLYKQLKTTKQVRSQVNISIIYKGVEYDNVDAMSGGEGDRVSLAFTIALNKIGGSPLLLLDECMSSLDVDTREQCLDCLRIPGKTVMVINHDGVEGHYDNVIFVNE